MANEDLTEEEREAALQLEHEKYDLMVAEFRANREKEHSLLLEKLKKRRGKEGFENSVEEEILLNSAKQEVVKSTVDLEMVKGEAESDDIGVQAVRKGLEAGLNKAVMTLAAETRMSDEAISNANRTIKLERTAILDTYKEKKRKQA